LVQEDNVEQHVNDSLALHHSATWSCEAVSTSIDNEICAQNVRETSDNPNKKLLVRVPYFIIELQEKWQLDKGHYNKGVKGEVHAAVVVSFGPVSGEHNV